MLSFQLCEEPIKAMEFIILIPKLKIFFAVPFNIILNSESVFFFEGFCVDHGFYKQLSEYYFYIRNLI